MFIIVGMAAALGIGIWVGLGFPGVNGPEDRVVRPGQSRRRLEKKHIDWLRPPRR